MTDAERILTLPTARTPDMVAHWTRLYRIDPTASPLRPLQSALLTAAAQGFTSGTQRGAFGNVGVGHGKTIPTLLFADVVAAQRPWLLVPPRMIAQLRRDIAIWGQRYRLTVPHIMSHAALSSAQSATQLEYHRPDLIIIDEAHAFRDPSAARTRRLLRYIDEHRDTTRLIVLSGTMTKRSLLDYAHLIRRCLCDMSPLPNYYPELERWAHVIDADGDATDHQAAWSVWPLAVAVGAPAVPPAASKSDDAGADERRRWARAGYLARLRTIPGVVMSTETSTDATLYLEYRRPKIPDAVSKMLAGIASTWELPDPDAVVGDGATSSDAIVDAATFARACGQVSSGFFYRWDWTFGGKRRRTILDDQWLIRRSGWTQAVRHALRYSSGPGYDSPLLVARAAACGEGSLDLLRTWRAWHEMSPEGTPWCDRARPPTLTTWVDPFVVADVGTYLHANADDPTLVWYQSRAMGEALRASGLPVYGAGSDVPKRLEHCALSVAAHGTGKNLQAWRRNFVIEPMANGAAWEQLLGRTHRPGQLDDVIATVLQHGDRNPAALAAAYADAEYIEATTGAAQKLLLAIKTA